MMAQKVMVQTVNSFGSNRAGVAANRNQDESNFALFMEKSMDTTKDSLSDAKTSTDEKSNREVNAAPVSDNAQKTEPTGISEETEKITEKVSEDSVQPEKPEELTEKEQLIGQITGMLETIKQTVMETLNLSEEELNQLMQEQGITMADLSGMDALKQLVLAGCGETDVAAVLTNENLSDTMQQLISAVDQIKTDAGITLTQEQIKDLLGQIQSLDPAAMESVAMAAGSEDSGIAQDNISAQGMAVEKKDATELATRGQDDSQTEEIRFTLTKESNHTGTRQEAAGEDSADSGQTDQYQEFVDNLSNVTVKYDTNVDGNITQTTQIREIANQIIETIRVMIRPDRTSMELQLNPENLGKVNLTIQSKNGMMTAQFVVQNEVSKEAIESQIGALRETLEQQGVKVEAIEVRLSEYTFGQSGQADSERQENQNKPSSGRKITMEEAFLSNDVPEEESNIADITGQRGSQVDYTA